MVPVHVHVAVVVNVHDHVNVNVNLPVSAEVVREPNRRPPKPLVPGYRSEPRVLVLVLSRRS